MIPIFPRFKKLESTDGDAVREFTKRYPPYSDFNFISMWSWNISGTMALSQLHNNLVVQFEDYLSGKPFLSFIGMSRINTTVSKLLEFSEEKFGESSLQLIPEMSVAGLDKKKFACAEDINHKDYILSTERLSKYEGKRFANKRTRVRGFLRDHPNFRLETLTLSDTNIHTRVKDLYALWHAQKKNNVDSKLARESEHEYKALTQCLHSNIQSQIIAAGIFIADVLQAFWFLEDIGSGYAMSHFEKADMVRFPGIAPFLRHQVAPLLRQRGVEFINMEQDLGIEGLRTSKESYNPCAYLKKYTVRRA